MGADTYSYRGWLVSDSLWKRVVAVWIYAVIGGLVVWGVFMVIVLLSAFIFGMSGI
jgi:hypothetical protein